jgi:hypothetical protein
MKPPMWLLHQKPFHVRSMAAVDRLDLDWFTYKAVIECSMIPKSASGASTSLKTHNGKGLWLLLQ